ncbi:cytochrome P450 [Armillaria gallica]|uniref:Cytochrome P450 n=1 Tax=Armillaria gallica TaxID=47427 RepID=A0A2H3DAV5_ARMGA|nr:cytochrome P450 [Armillaria gallica]
MSSFIPLLAIIIAFVCLTPAVCDFLSISILGRRLVVINSAQTAIDILDKKGAFYSDRPIMGMIGELMGFKNWLVLLPYGPRFRNQRRLVRQQLSSHAAMKQFSLIVEHETGRLLRRLSAKPEHLSDQIQKTIGAILLRIIYGYEIQEENDLFLELVDRSSHCFALAMTPGKFLANSIPIIRHIPDWFPGFKQIAKEWRATIYDMVDRTHEHAKQQMAVGKGSVSFTSKMLEDEPSAEEEKYIKLLAATLYGGFHLHSRYLLTRGQTAAAVYAFFKAMLLFPDLPRSDDRERLPYINALVLEVSRWHTVAPLVNLEYDLSCILNTHYPPKIGVPHSAKEDGVQKMLHDPAVYKQPFDFNPDRFIRAKDTEPEADPYGVAFGFGRRMLADSSIFIVCAMVLATFNISKYSENGVVLEPDAGHTAGNISHPTPFKCTIKARSAKALSLINEEGFA